MKQSKISTAAGGSAFGAGCERSRDLLAQQGETPKGVERYVARVWPV
ncbi:hypothetical protein [Streptomyces sp. NPDC048425]